MGLNDHKTGKEANPWAQQTDQELEKWLKKTDPNHFLMPFSSAF